MMAQSINSVVYPVVMLICMQTLQMYRQNVNNALFQTVNNVKIALIVYYVIKQLTCI